MSLTTGQARAHNLGATFLAADPSASTYPCIELPDGRRCYFFYDDDGVLNVTVDLDDDHEEASLRITVGNSIINQEMVVLPGWDEMSDLDKGAALMHVAKRHYEEDDEFAIEHYPARYLDDPRLTKLSPKTASNHAARVVGDLEELGDRIGQDEYDRLFMLAFNASRDR
ncbi:hypothetical protein E1287_30655 [Actinomadura sp. KC06]|uniref:hypothetical protein n=1 Tax=Actinomadura sp. KC06 TaxID=2530369 RepID=UPI00104D8C8E|nr:hypothetical protein [Actinomadura sp. KC06]TDD29644.1 hypothetical protein E1287_30655 [Actinomadura sp. KC06]